MKNKHNTMNSASSQKTYMKMQNKLLEDDQAVCYLVEVISMKSMKSKDEPWKVSIDGRPFLHSMPGNAVALRKREAPFSSNLRGP